MSLQLRFELPSKLFLKDPQDSDYGKRLLSNSVELIDELGFESFTFRKLGIKMNSTEVSIYRYFENKHLLLLYLNCWYWEWLGYLIKLSTMNVEDSIIKLKNAINCLINAHNKSKLSHYINEKLLFQIIMNESSKTYHVAKVDEENKDGFFIPYKELVAKLAAIIEEINPQFIYANSLGTTMFEMICNQLYYVEHLPRLSSLKRNNTLKELEKMVNYFVFAIIEKK